MYRIRTFFLVHRTLALALVTLALAMKLLVPAGMMVEARGDLSLTVVTCSGMGAVETVTIPVERDHVPRGGDQQQSLADKQACGFGALGQPMLGGANVIQLALALAFILLVGLAPRPASPLRKPAHRWPPMRGPPVAA